MSDVVFNISKGDLKDSFELALANDALIVVPIEFTGLEADATLKDYDTLSALLAASNNEQTTMGRKTITAATVTVDDTNDRLDLDIADQTWTAATGNRIGKLVVCYDSDTTGGTDANVIPLTAHDFDVTPSGSDIVAQISASGLARAA